MTTAPGPAVGADRVSVAPDGTILLASRHAKEGWHAPQDNGPVHAPFPGTCVRWNDEFFEVVGAEVLRVGVRYSLRPWEEARVMRTVADYDEASEEKRHAERLAELNRARFRRISIPSALLLGNLPGEVQERIGSEMGVRAHRMTMIGLSPLFIFGAGSVVFLLARVAGGPSPLPLPWLLLGVYFFVESLFRFASAFGAEKPVGTLLLEIPYTVGRFVAGIGKPKRERPQVHADPSVLQRDAYAIREPILALLPPAEQLALQARYGFEPVRWGRRTAILFLAAAAAGIYTSVQSIPQGSGMVSLAASAYLAIEQVVRLLRLASGQPAGSVLGVLLKPFAATLLR